MKSLKELENIRGKRILVRVDFNVPIDGSIVIDNFRIKKSLATIKYLKDSGAKIILISHLGKGGESLSVVARELNKFLKVEFVEDIVGKRAEDAVLNLMEGEILLLENLRNDSREKASDVQFARDLARYANIYVNEAFSVSHRNDASITLLPTLLDSYAGFQFIDEVENLSKAFNDIKHPFLFILGGAKFSTKIPVIEKYLEIADYVFIGGAIANDLIRARGFNIGLSLADAGDYDFSKVLSNKKLIIPIDVLVKNKNSLFNRKLDAILPDDVIVDIGGQTHNMLLSLIIESRFVVWNGPLGKYEDGGDLNTKEALKEIIDSKCESIIGGGDLVSLAKNEKDISFVSTGGGAMLEFLLNKTLPGIEALK